MDNTVPVLSRVLKSFVSALKNPWNLLLLICALLSSAILMVLLGLVFRINLGTAFIFYFLTSFGRLFAPLIGIITKAAVPAPNIGTLFKVLLLVVAAYALFAITDSVLSPQRRGARVLVKIIGSGILFSVIGYLMYMLAGSPYQG